MSKSVHSVRAWRVRELRLALAELVARLLGLVAAPLLLARGLGRRRRAQAQAAAEKAEMAGSSSGGSSGGSSGVAAGSHAEVATDAAGTKLGR